MTTVTTQLGSITGKPGKRHPDVPGRPICKTPRG